jgi:hypothetical protein
METPSLGPPLLNHRPHPAIVNHHWQQAAISLITTLV